MKGAEVAKVAFLIAEEAVVAAAWTDSAWVVGISSRKDQRPFLYPVTPRGGDNPVTISVIAVIKEGSS